MAPDCIKQVCGAFGGCRPVGIPIIYIKSDVLGRPLCDAPARPEDPNPLLPQKDCLLLLTCVFCFVFIDGKKVALWHDDQLRIIIL